MAPVCPKCGKPAYLTKTLYGDRYDHCGLVAWGNKPLTDNATRQARRAAHAAFDPLWQSGRLKRDTAYQMLADELGVPEPLAHMNVMERELALRVPEAVEQIKKHIGDQP